MQKRLKLSRYVIASEPLGHADSTDCHHVIFNSRTAKPYLLTQALWHAVLSDELYRLPDAVIADLVRDRILVDAADNELLEVISDNLESINNSNHLYHVIQPTAACQLGCHYCGQKHSKQTLSTADQDGLIDRLDRKLQAGQYTNLTISWFGSEPLVGLPIMRRLSPRLKALANRHGASYSAKIVTNGMLLTRSIAFELQRTHAVVEAEVTLDGPPRVHDARRMTKANRPSFQRILSNLREITNEPISDLRIVIRCNVDRDNYRYVNELIDLLANEGLSDRISFYISPVYSWGNDADDNALTLEEFGQWEIEWFARLHNRGFRVGLLPPRKKIVCLAVQQDGELTDAFGDVFNCTEVSYVPAYGSPNKYRLGKLNDTPVAAPFRNFNDSILEGKQVDCGNCNLLPVCGGSCPKLWSEGKVPCPSLKSNIKERLVLWYAMKKLELRSTQKQDDQLALSSR